jgi:hypothetical protein
MRGCEQTRGSPKSLFDISILHVMSTYGAPKQFDTYFRTWTSGQIQDYLGLLSTVYS